MFLETISGASFELVEVPARFGDTDDRHVEVTALQHRLERRKDFFVSQVARGAEENKGIGMHCVHGSYLHSGFFQVSAEFVAHARKKLLLKIRVAARTEPLIKRGGQDRRRHAFINGSLDCPAALARVGDTPGESREAGILD